MSGSFADSQLAAYVAQSAPDSWRARCGGAAGGNGRAGALPGLQVLLYANTDLTGAQPSMLDKAEGWGQDVTRIRFFNLA